MCFSLVDRKNAEMIFSSFKSPFCIFLGGGKILGRKGRRSGDKGLRGERGELISTGKGVEKILGRKGGRSGGKKANRERGERSKEGKGRSSQGGKGLRRERVGDRIWKGLKGKGGKDLNGERGQRILRRNREKISAGERP